MSSHHDYILEITAEHDAFKPFPPENGQPLRFALGDAVIVYQRVWRTVPVPRHRVLSSQRTFGPVRARCALPAGLVIAVGCRCRKPASRPDDPASMPSRPWRGATRCACLQGKALRAIPAAQAWRPSRAANRLVPDRSLHAGHYDGTSGVGVSGS